MKIDQIPEFQQISATQARTKAKRAEGQATIAATGKYLAKLKAEMGIDDNDYVPAPSGINWLPFAMVAAIAATAGLWAGMMLTGGVT